MSADTEESLILQAKKCFIFDDFVASIKIIDQVLEKYPSSQGHNTYILFRAICNYKLKQFDLALKDLDILEKDETYKKDFNYFLTRGKV